RPGEAPVDEVLAQRRAVDGQDGSLPAVPVRVEDELTVPVLGLFDPVRGTVDDAGENGRVGQGDERRAVGVAVGVEDDVAGLRWARYGWAADRRVRGQGGSGWEQDGREHDGRGGEDSCRQGLAHGATSARHPTPIDEWLSTESRTSGAGSALYATLWAVARARSLLIRP